MNNHHSFFLTGLQRWFDEDDAKLAEILPVVVLEIHGRGSEHQVNLEFYELLQLEVLLEPSGQAKSLEVIGKGFYST